MPQGETLRVDLTTAERQRRQRTVPALQRRAHGLDLRRRLPGRLAGQPVRGHPLDHGGHLLRPGPRPVRAGRRTRRSPWWPTCCRSRSPTSCPTTAATATTSPPRSSARSSTRRRSSSWSGPASPSTSRSATRSSTDEDHRHLRPDQRAARPVRRGGDQPRRRGGARAVPLPGRAGAAARRHRRPGRPARRLGRPERPVRLLAVQHDQRRHPYVEFQFGVPGHGANNSQDGSNVAVPGADHQPPGQPERRRRALGSVTPIVNTNGEVLATGYAFDFADQSNTTLSFVVQTYPDGLRAAASANPPASTAFAFNIIGVGHAADDRANSSPSRRSWPPRCAPTSSPTRPPRRPCKCWRPTRPTGPTSTSGADPGGPAAARGQARRRSRKTRCSFSLQATLAAGILAGPAGKQIITNGNLTRFLQPGPAVVRHDAEHSFPSTSAPAPTRRPPTRAAPIVQANPPPASDFNLNASQPTHYEGFYVYVPYANDYDPGEEDPTRFRRDASGESQLRQRRRPQLRAVLHRRPADRARRRSTARWATARSSSCRWPAAAVHDPVRELAGRIVHGRPGPHRQPARPQPRPAHLPPGRHQARRHQGPHPQRRRLVPGRLRLHPEQGLHPPRQRRHRHQLRHDDLAPAGDRPADRRSDHRSEQGPAAAGQRPRRRRGLRQLHGRSRWPAWPPARRSARRRACCSTPPPRWTRHDHLHHRRHGADHDADGRTR